LSIHLLECAANLQLPASTKLALMAFADSADRHTHIALPGLDQVQTWSGLGRSRAAEVVSDLVDLGLLKKHRSGHRGRRAEYVVFPEGCCDEHRREPEEASDVADPIEEKGSGEPDSSSVIGSAGPDPIHAEEPNGSAGPDAFTEKGSGKGPTATGPLPSYVTTTPPSPRTAGGDRCAKPGPKPHANCRGCGTTNRQLAEQRNRDAEAERRRAEQARHREQQAALAAARRPTEERPAAIEQLLKEARRTLATTRSTS
jgi:hypothetical protein